MIETLILFAIVGFLAIGVQSCIGFGGGLVAIPLLTLWLAPTQAIPAYSIMMTSMNLVLIIETRAHVRWREIPFLLAGGLIGVPIGAWLLTTLSTEIIGLAICLLVLSFAVLLWCKLKPPLPNNRPTQTAIGFCSGLFGGATTMPGPPVVFYGLAQNWNKHAFRGTLLCYFLCLSITGLISYAAGGLITTDTFCWAGVAFMAGLPASWLGIKIKNRISQALFSKIVLSIITLLALSRLISYLLL